MREIMLALTSTAVVLMVIELCQDTDKGTQLMHAVILGLNFSVSVSTIVSMSKDD